MNSTIIIADKYPMTRIGLKTFFKTSPFNVVCILENGVSAYSEIVKQKPDIAILDYDLPGINGLEVAQLCSKYNLSTKIIIFTNLNLLAICNEIGKSIDGYVLKDDEEQVLEECLIKVNNNSTYLSQAVFQSKKKRLNFNLGDTISFKELRVLKLVSQGNSSQDISEQLHLSRRTIEKHRSSIIKKLNISSSQFGLIQWAKDNFESING